MITITMVMIIDITTIMMHTSNNIKIFYCITLMNNEELIKEIE